MRQFLLLCLLLSLVRLDAQRTAYFDDTQYDFFRGQEYFDHHVHSRAFIAYDDLLKDIPPGYVPDYDLLRTFADFRRAESAIQNGDPHADVLVLQFIEEHQPDPVAVDATIAIANFYFSSRKFDKAIAFYDLIEGQELDKEVYTEAKFKKGYAQYSQRDYAAAENSFKSIASFDSDYYYPANYYLGICRLKEKDYAGAVQYLERAEKAEPYNREVPYYTTLLYFADQNYEQVIVAGNRALKQKKVRKRAEIEQLVGQAHFELGNYSESVPYLEAFDAGSSKMTRSEFYQLAFAQYMSGECESAVSTFKNIAGKQDDFGLRANFYIAVCQLESGNMQEARNAFRAVSRIDTDPELQEEAFFNYGKLSAQLKYDSEAIHTLNRISPSSQYYTEAQSILKDVFNSTRDYATSIMTLEGVTEMSPTMKQAYQDLALKLGLQYLRDGNIEGALVAFEKVSRFPIDPALSAQSYFWRSEIAHGRGNYSESKDLMNRYFTLSRTAQELPPESSPALASYTQGYNYLQEEAFGMALEQFSSALDGISQSHEVSNLQNIEIVISDSETRSGDCLFKLARYDEADVMYSKVIEKQGYESVYAAYQKAIILGLEGQPLDKILLLESIAKNTPDSKYADDALYQAAVTNQEIGNSDRALQQYQVLVNDYPNSEYITATKLRQGLISYNNGDLNSAIEYYKGVFSSNPSSNEAKEALTALEEIYVHDLSRPAEYFAFAESVPGYELNALRKDSITFRTAEFLYEQGDYDKANLAFDKYINQFPKGAYIIKANYYKGESLALLKQYSEALAAYDAVVDGGPSSFYVNALKKAASLSYHGMNDFNAASGYYSKLTETVTDPVELYDAHIGRMRSAFRVEKYDGMSLSASYLLNVEQVPDDINAEANFYLANASIKAQQYDNAIMQFNQVVNLSDNAMTAESRYMVGWIYFERSQFKLAEQICHNAIGANANYPEWVVKGLLLLSDIYAAQNDFFNAKAPLEAIIESFTGEYQYVEEAQHKLNAIESAELEASRVKNEDTPDSNEQEPENNEK